MKKLVKLSISFVLVLCLFTGKYYANDEGNSFEASAADNQAYTIFIYMCGTDLESEGQFATKNLNELMRVTYNSNVNVIVQTGGTNTWHTDGIDSEYIQRFKITKNNMTLLDEVPLASMGTSDTLKSFLEWGVEAYPSDRYGLIFWNHGGGSIGGVAVDEIFENDSLTLPEIDNALEAANNKMNQHFEFIGFDACLMASMELALVLDNYSNYMVASEETEPGCGWNYQVILDAVNTNPVINGDALGKIICDSFITKCAVEGDDELVTLSVIDLSKMTMVKSAFDAVVDELEGKINDVEVLSVLAKGANQSEKYGSTGRGDISNIIDLGDLIENIAGVIPGSATNCINAIDKATFYKVSGSSRAEATGLSIFFPSKLKLQDATLLQQYEPVAVSQDYYNLLNILTSMDTSNINISASYEAFLQSLAGNGGDYNAQGYFQMDINPDYLEFVSSIKSVLSIEEDGKEVLLGSDSKLYFDYETGTIIENFHGLWPTLNGNFVTCYLVEEQENYKLFIIPIVLNGNEAYVQARWTIDYIDGDFVKGQYEITGIWDGIDAETGVPSREFYEFEAGDEIIPLFDVYDYETQESNRVEGNPFYVENTVSLEETALPTGDYWFAFEIEDIFGEYHYSDFTKISLMSNLERLVMIKSLYGLKDGDNGYDNQYDLNSDGVIDVLDVVIVLK